MKKALFTLLFCLPVIVFGNTNPLISRKTFFSNPQKTEVKLSPNGNHLSYLAPFEGILNLWVRDVEKANDHPVTSLKKRPISDYAWSTDGQHLLYLCDFGGDENHHLFSLDLASNETRNLTPYPGTKVNLLHISNKISNEILVTINDRDPKLFDVYRLNIITGNKTLLFENNQNFSDFLADDSLSLRAAIRCNEDGEIELHARKSRKEIFSIIQKYSLEDSRFIKLISISDDLLIYKSSKERDKTALKSYSFNSRKTSEIFYSEEAEVSDIILHPKTNSPQVVFTYGLKQNDHLLDKSLNADWKSILRKAEGKTITATSRNTNHNYWILSLTSDTTPAEYYLYDEQTKASKYLFSSNEPLSSLTLPKKQSFTIQSRDNFSLTSYLIQPLNTEGPTPMVLFVHGGPWCRDKFEYNSIQQWLANRGYSVLSVNFRGSSGLGKSFLNAGNREWGKKMQDDLEDAVYWAIENKIADPNKIAIMGGSYGGYATLVGLTKTPELFAAGIDIVGPSHLQTLLDSIPSYWAIFRKEMDLRMGPLGDKKFFDTISPLTYVDKINKPLLIMQGKNDPRVKCTESEQIVTALREKSIPVTYTIFPDEGHGFRKEANNLASLAIIEKFLSKYLGGRSEPLADSIKNSSAEIPIGFEFLLDE